MATKVEQPSGSTSATSSVAASSPKISMFGKKTGFVIPKNKLSGSLVPIVRGGSKSEIADAPKEESSKQTRKTKWGIDLTQDNAVRRGRALAYQTRVEQITNQLESRTLEFEDDHGSEPPSQTPKHSFSDRGVDKELEELLQLERREAIGECIKLNPSYKAPPGYKPVLREAKVPVPLKAYPNINFIGLVLGPDNSTKKRLEEETGAKIQTRGTKAGSGEKPRSTSPPTLDFSLHHHQVEVNLSDDVGAHGVYEELYVHVSAETYEKVDSAVALVELLVTPVSGKPAASTDSSSVSTDITARNQNQVEVAPAGYMMPMSAGNLWIQTGPPPQGLYLPYSGPWQPPNLYMRPAPSFAFMPNAIPMANAPPRFPPSNVPTFNAPPVSGAGSTASPMLNADVIPIRSQPPVPVMQQPYTHEVRPQNPGLSSRPFPVQQPQSFANAIPRPNTLPPSAFASGQSLPAASSGMSGTSVQALAQPAVMPQTGAVTGGLLPNMPPTGNPYGWSGASSVLPARMTNMTPMPPRMMPDSSRPVSSVTLPPTANGMAAAPIQRPAETRTFSSPAPGNPALQSHMQMAKHPTVSQLTPGSTLSHPSAPLGPRPIQSPLPGRPPIPPALQTPSNVMPGPLPAQASGLAPPAPVASQPLPSTSLSQVSSSLARPTVLSIQSSPAALSIRPGLAQVSPLTPGSITPVSTGQGLPQMRIASPQPAAAPLASVSGSLANLPSSNIFRPQRPSSSDFTFQPQNPQASTSQGETRPSIQLGSQNPLSRPQGPPIQSPPVPHPPSFRAAVHNLQPQPGIHGFARPNAPISNQTVIQRPSQPAGFRGNPNIASPPPFVNPIGPPRLLNQSLQRAPPGIGGSQSLNMPPPLPLHGSLPVRPGNLQQIRNTPVPMNQQAGFAVMSQPTSGNHGYTSNVNQIYDPFSPTSIASQQAGNAAKSGVESRQQDTDAEYEDLMASVGVK